ncbi:hypothetical protein ACL02R_01510 [Streptomyces sp. MS19]|uniref:hypothetical protein n=1 Tax=Streptomyces sp. MS19 TaxID=3385972 RepID=UPI00399F4A83
MPSTPAAPPRSCAPPPRTLLDILRASVAAWPDALALDDGECETHWLPEPDLVRIRDGAVVGRACVVQTHLFHDRVMRLDTVDIGPGAVPGPHTIALPGSRIGGNTTVGPASLVMAAEHLPAGARWQGNPAHPSRG